ncbi:hypothetical protein QLX52_28670 [Streptomyces albus]|uniref:DUF6414 family protein n=1 Tax=Streptomyces albus TaxID=1888 RepID=UPI0024ADDEA9|nr:hypothetical protein [Streptomyces albus]MDI6412782.1 hypothetical protein [Streptomyces albus]
MRNLPDSDIPDIREYLYVDTPRVRSLLAQFAAGLPENRMSDRTKKWTASFSQIVGLGRERSTSDQETRSLADLHVAMLEEDAESLGLLSDVSIISQKKKNWNRGKLHRILSPGNFIRVTALTQIIDPASFAATARAMDSLGDDSSFSEQVTLVTEALYRGQLVFRVLPCGTDETEYRYTGIVADPGNYLSDERSALNARFGAKAQEWTTLALVSRVPEQNTAPPLSRFESAVQGLAGAFEGDPDRLDRGALESLIQEAARALEDFGLSEAPNWPAISVTPLAVYRNLSGFAVPTEMEEDD